CQVERPRTHTPLAPAPRLEAFALVFLAFPARHVLQLARQPLLGRLTRRRPVEPASAARTKPSAPPRSAAPSSPASRAASRASPNARRAHANAVSRDVPDAPTRRSAIKADGSESKRTC